MKISYNHLAPYFKEKISIEVISNSLFQLGHEHEIEDDIFDIEFTPNRGDCLSIQGLLRDLSSLHHIDYSNKIYNKNIEELNIDFKNNAKDLCPSISFLKIEVSNNIDEYKGCLEQYFENLGLNKNNFFADISNYISYETGQPTHCYDENKLGNNLLLDKLKKSSEFTTLLDKKIKLQENDLVFSSDGNVINLAGIIGGESSACSTKTRSVVIECAYFKPDSIINKSTKYDIQSEAAHKFERNTDHNCHETVLRRFISIVEEHAEITKLELKTFRYEDFKEKKILFDNKKINKIIGLDLSAKEYELFLNRLHFIVENNFVLVPSFRNDINSQNDLAEEVARIIGYDNIKTNKLNIVNYQNNHHEIEKTAKIKSFLVDNGFYEVINFPFVQNGTKNNIFVDNPLDSSKKFLREELVKSLINNLAFNERRQKDSIKLFEISDVYRKSGSEIKKRKKLAVIASGRVGHNYRDFSKILSIKYIYSLFKDFFNIDMSEIKLIQRSEVDSKSLYPIVVFEIDMNLIPEKILEYQVKSKHSQSYAQFIPTSELPSSSRDLSFSVIEQRSIKLLEQLLLDYKNHYIKEIFIFDYYANKSKNETKVGYRFIFQSVDKTMTDDIVDQIMNDIIINTIKIDGVTIPGLNHEH